MLDDRNVLKQRDARGVIDHLDSLIDQLGAPIEFAGSPKRLDIRNIVIYSEPSELLAADLVKTLTAKRLGVPLEIITSTELPGYAWEQTVVIAICSSVRMLGMPELIEEMISRGAPLVIISGDRGVTGQVSRNDIMTISIPINENANTYTIFLVRAILVALKRFELIDNSLPGETTNLRNWLAQESQRWHPDVPTHENYAKQLSLQGIGKTPLFYSGPNIAPLTKVWKTAWNRRANNLAFASHYPMAGYADLDGWKSHPVEKPFAVFELLSSHDSSYTTSQMQLTDTLISGRRPKPVSVHLDGDSLLQQLLWGYMLGQYVAGYAAILNGVDPAVYSQR